MTIKTITKTKKKTKSMPSMNNRKKNVAPLNATLFYYLKFCYIRLRNDINSPFVGFSYFPKFPPNSPFAVS